MFTLKTDTIMSRSPLDYRIWAIAAYLMVTNIKGISSMKLHRELGITQKTAWHLLHRLRKAYELGTFVFQGPVEADETYMGGKEASKHAHKKLRAGRGPVGKTAVAGLRDRATGKINAAVVQDTTAGTLQQFVCDNTEIGARVYTDEAAAYRGMPGVQHEVVRHSVGEYVNGMIHTNSQVPIVL